MSTAAMMTIKEVNKNFFIVSDFLLGYGQKYCQNVKIGADIAILTKEAHGFHFIVEIN